MNVKLEFVTQGDQVVAASADYDNPSGIVVTVSEMDGKNECRLYLDPKEIETLYKIMLDANTYRLIK